MKPHIAILSVLTMFACLITGALIGEATGSDGAALIPSGLVIVALLVHGIRNRRRART